MRYRDRPVESGPSRARPMLLGLRELEDRLFFLSWGLERRGSSPVLSMQGVGLFAGSPADRRLLNAHAFVELHALPRRGG